MYTVRLFAIHVGAIYSIVLSAVQEEGGTPEVEVDAVDLNKPTYTKRCIYIAVP